jgi:hypothetical protein
MRPLGMRIAFELVLGAVLIASLVLILRESRRITEYQRRQEADAQALRLLREAWRQKGLQKGLPPAAEEIPAENDRSDIEKREAVIERLDRELAETRVNLADLQSQLATCNEQNAKALADAEC